MGGTESGVVWFELDKLTSMKNVSRAASTWSSAYEVLQERTTRSWKSEECQVNSLFHKSRQSTQANIKTKGALTPLCMLAYLNIIMAYRDN